MPEVDADFIYEDFDVFRIYDAAVISEFSMEWENKEIPFVFATPQRAFAAVSNMLGVDNARMPLPIMSLERTGFSPSTQRQMVGPNVRLGNPNFPNLEHVTLSEAPKAIDIEYQVNCWCKTRTQLNTLQTIMMRHFTNDVTVIRLEIPAWGQFGLVTRLTSLSDTSVLDPGEDTRKMRFTASLVLAGFIFHVPRVMKTIGKITIESETREEL